MKYLIEFVLVCLCVVLADQKLLYAQTFIRHGATYPSGDFYDAASYKENASRLTGVGMRQQYLLGADLKYAYVTDAQLIPAKYNPKLIEVFTTSYPRSVSSALSFLYGLFPTQQGWMIPEEVGGDRLVPPFLGGETSGGPGFALKQGFQPIPSYPLDSVFNNCPNYGVLETNRYKEIGSVLTQFQAQHSPEITKMKLVFNLTSLQLTLPAMRNLYDTIISDLNLGVSMPKNFEDYDQKELKFIADYYSTSMFGGSFGAVLSTPIFRLIRRNLERVDQSACRWSIYQVHQSNLTPLIVSLNLTSPDCLQQKWKGLPITALNCMTTPDFSASLTLELHEDDTFQRFVQIQYNGEYVYLCESKQLKCKLTEFLARLAAAETNFEAQCKVTANREQVIMSSI